MPPEDNYDDDLDQEYTVRNAESESDVASVGLLPKSILRGKHFNVGDEIVLTIAAIHDDQVEVEYATEGEDNGGEPEGGAEPEPEPGEEKTGEEELEEAYQ